MCHFGSLYHQLRCHSSAHFVLPPSHVDETDTSTRIRNGTACGTGSRVAMVPGGQAEVDVTAAGGEGGGGEEASPAPVLRQGRAGRGGAGQSAETRRRSRPQSAPRGPDPAASLPLQLGAAPHRPPSIRPGSPTTPAEPRRAVYVRLSV